MEYGDEKTERMVRIMENISYLKRKIQVAKESQNPNPKLKVWQKELNKATRALNRVRLYI